MPTPPRRRWFQFSLRTLLVALALLATCLWMVGRTVRQRQSLIREAVGNGGEVLLISEMSDARRATSFVKEYHVPFWRRWLGDQAVPLLRLSPDATDEDCDRAQDLFPEAKVGVVVPGRVPLESLKRK